MENNSQDIGYHELIQYFAQYATTEEIEDWLLRYGNCLDKKTVLYVLEHYLGITVSNNIILVPYDSKIVDSVLNSEDNWIPSVFRWKDETVTMCQLLDVSDDGKAFEIMFNMILQKDSGRQMQFGAQRRFFSENSAGIFEYFVMDHSVHIWKQL